MDAVEKSGPETDPEVWLVRDGKLYLFMYELPKRKFLMGNVDLRVSAGLKIWASFTDGAPDAYMNTGCFWWDADCGHSGDACASNTDA